MADLTLAARLILAGAVAAAGVAKLMDQGGARQAVRSFGVPGALVTPLAAVLPFAELASAVALLVTATALAGAIGALALLGGFITAITLNLGRGRQPDCRCFGQLHSAPVGWNTLVRNGALAGLAIFVLAKGPGTSLAGLLAGLTGIEWVAVVVAVALAVAFAREGSLFVNRWRQKRAPPRTRA
ncbi:MAG: methylamine utilization protein MauE [Actinomycetota bacterium]|nr:methylamine utilization protein MauE [Actinomycetota bacterium]